jgi:hypothetical protein
VIQIPVHKTFSNNNRWSDCLMDLYNKHKQKKIEPTMNKHCTALNNISTYPHSHSPPSLVPSLIAGIGTAVDDGHQFQFVGVLEKSFDD